VEEFVIDRIKSHVLTDDNMEELVRLTNEELAQAYGEEKEKLEFIHTQMDAMDSRLGRLYDALEAGDFKNGELAPRIRVLTQKKEELLQVKAEVEEKLRNKCVDMADPQVVRDYAIDLKNLLAKSSISEQRSFLKSFIDRIDVDDTKVKVHYTIPVPPHNISEETVGVLPFVHHG
jgi:hypothetical protein